MSTILVRARFVPPSGSIESFRILDIPVTATVADVLHHVYPKSHKKSLIFVRATTEDEEWDDVETINIKPDHTDLEWEMWNNMTDSYLSLVVTHGSTFEFAHKDAMCTMWSPSGDGRFEAILWVARTGLTASEMCDELCVLADNWCADAWYIGNPVHEQWIKLNKFADMTTILSAGPHNHYAIPYPPTATTIREMRSNGYDVDCNWTWANFNLEEDDEHGSDEDDEHGSDEE